VRGVACPPAVRADLGCHLTFRRPASLRGKSLNRRSDNHDAMTIARTAHATRLRQPDHRGERSSLTRVAFTADRTAIRQRPWLRRAHAFEAVGRSTSTSPEPDGNLPSRSDWSRMSAFDAMVLQTLSAATGYGETISYGEIAQPWAALRPTPASRWRVGAQPGSDHHALPSAWSAATRPHG